MKNKKLKCFIFVEIFIILLLILHLFCYQTYGFSIIGNTEALSSFDDFSAFVLLISTFSLFHYFGGILPYCQKKYGKDAAKKSLEILLYKFLASFVFHVFITDLFVGIEFILIFVFMFVGAKAEPVKKNVSNKNVDFLKDDVSNDILKKCGITDDINKLKKDICDAYIKIQNAWSVNDIDKVRNLLSDELYNMYKMQIMTMINKNQRNIISDFSNIEVFINSVNLKKDSFFIKATLVVDCKAYMIDSVTNNVLRGNSNELSRFYYSLIFQKSRKEGIKNCPNCNAKIDNLSGRRVKCNYCGSIIHKKSTSIILIDKKKIN